jgi:hypothetical protein
MPSITILLVLLDIGPLHPAKSVITRVAHTPAEVGVPRADGPVELQLLHQEFRHRVVQI